MIYEDETIKIFLEDNKLTMQFKVQIIKMKTMIINKKILRTILYINFRDIAYIIEKYIEKINYIYYQRNSYFS